MIVSLMKLPVINCEAAVLIQQQKRVATITRKINKRVRKILNKIKIHQSKWMAKKKKKKDEKKKGGIKL